jgi:putative transposase
MVILVRFPVRLTQTCIAVQLSLRPRRPQINFSTVFAGQAVGIKEVHDDIWLVSFMDYDLGYFDLETRMLEPLENPFGPKVLPM